LNAEFTAIKAEIDRIGTKTTFNGAAIFQGGTANYSQLNMSDATVGGLGMSTKVTGQLHLVGGSGGTAYTFNSSAADATVGDLIADVNKNGGGLIAALDGSGKLMITDTKGRGTDNATKIADSATTASDLKVGGDSAAATLTSGPTNASTMDVFLSDSTSVGSSTISVALNQFDSGHMNGASVANDDLLSAGTAQTALNDINGSIAQVAALRGNIGAGINRLQSATNVMNNQNQNLSGAEDGIRSADITQQVANLTKFQILSQTGISALAQANQMQQSVLKLLQ
jgi:flagellin